MHHRVRRSRGQAHPIPGVSRAGVARSTLAATLHRLQRSVGNRAVEAMLAAGGSQKTPTRGARAIIRGVGTIPLESVQLAPVSRMDKGRGGTPKKGEPSGGELYLTSKQGPHSVRLSRALIEGVAWDVEVILPRGEGGLRLVLKGAIVSSYTVESDTGDQAVESWSLNFESMTQSIDGEMGE